MLAGADTPRNVLGREAAGRGRPSPAAAAGLREGGDCGKGGSAAAQGAGRGRGSAAVKVGAQERAPRRPPLQPFPALLPGTARSGAASPLRQPCLALRSAAVPARPPRSPWLTACRGGAALGRPACVAAGAEASGAPGGSVSADGMG